MRPEKRAFGAIAGHPLARFHRTALLGTAVGPEYFDFHLPEQQIAQQPLPSRSRSRMLVLGEDGPRETTSAALAEVLRSEVLVVVNNTRVVPARVFATRTSDRRGFEMLICEAAAHMGPGEEVRAWVRGARRLQIGDRLAVGGLSLEMVREDLLDPRARIFRIEAGQLLAELSKVGQVPLPPYIRRDAGPDAHDSERYQTVYAQHPGSVAAPTAGLHFDKELLAHLDICEITLHVGPGTFLPMEATDIREHRVGPERYSVSEAAATKIAAARAAGRPILAVGTTSCRTLEGIAAAHDGEIVAGEGWTDLVITPDHRWQVVSGLLTNFHLPRSSLLMLVSSLGGRDRVLSAYEVAVARGFRFYSYGDCMLLDRTGTVFRQDWAPGRPIVTK